jgi:uncharacterized protein (TIGR02145 family)
MKKNVFFLIIAFVLIFTNCKKDDGNTNINNQNGTVTDIDGNIYHYITIGQQVWMVENLNVSHYRNGDPIPNISDSITWSTLTTGAYCNYYNLPANGLKYGKLYNWYSVNDSRKIAPIGWHVATDAEWITLVSYLGGIDIAGGKLKALTLWNSPNTGATNSSGFTAFAGGFRNQDTFIGIGERGSWWSSTEDSNYSAWCRFINYNGTYVYRNSSVKKVGLSVRCIKD